MNFKLSLAQLTSTDVVADNLTQIESQFRAAGGSDLVVFPENSLFFRIRGGSAITGITLEGPELARLQTLVDGGSPALMLTTPLREGGAMHNATIVLQPRRAPEVLYRKIHLFDVDVPGAPPVRESETFAGGREPATWTFRGWNFGLSICYDVRFAELYLKYAQKVDVILIPAAFLVPTGQAHWEVLLRARAIESQCYVAAPAQSGDHVAAGQTRKTYGHSLLVDPWGTILSQQSTSPGVATVELSRGPLETVRRQIPMGSHRRL